MSVMDKVTGKAKPLDLLAPPKPLELSSFPEYRALFVRLGVLQEKDSQIGRRLAEIEVEASRQSDASAYRQEIANALLSADTIQAFDAQLPDASHLEKERRKLLLLRPTIALAIAEGRDQLRALAIKLSGRACEPLKTWHRAVVQEMAQHSIELARLWEAEGQALESVADAGLSIHGLCEHGGARPRFAAPAEVAPWVEWLVRVGLLPRREPYTSAAEMTAGPRQERRQVARREPTQRDVAAYRVRMAEAEGQRR